MHVAERYVLYETDLLPLVTTGVGENYTLVDEGGGCSLTDADRETCDELCTRKQKEDPSLKY